MNPAPSAFPYRGGSYDNDRGKDDVLAFMKGDINTLKELGQFKRKELATWRENESKYSPDNAILHRVLIDGMHSAVLLTCRLRDSNSTLENWSFVTHLCTLKSCLEVVDELSLKHRLRDRIPRRSEAHFGHRAEGTAFHSCVAFASDIWVLIGAPSTNDGQVREDVQLMDLFVIQNWIHAARENIGACTLSQADWPDLFMARDCNIACGQAEVELDAVFAGSNGRKNQNMPPQGEKLLSHGESKRTTHRLLHGKGPVRHSHSGRHRMLVPMGAQGDQWRAA